MNFKTLLIIAMTLSSTAAFAQKKKRVRRDDRNSLADSYFAARIQGAQNQSAKRQNDSSKNR